MDTLTKRKLKMLVESEHWDVIHLLFAEVSKKWNNEPVKNDTEWLTLWAVAEKQGKIDGVREFINSIEELAHEN